MNRFLYVVRFSPSLAIHPSIHPLRSPAHLPRENKRVAKSIQFRSFPLLHRKRKMVVFSTLHVPRACIDRQRLSSWKIALGLVSTSRSCAELTIRRSAPECTRHENKILRLFCGSFSLTIVGRNRVSLLVSFNTAHTLRQWQSHSVYSSIIVIWT